MYVLHNVSYNVYTATNVITSRPRYRDMLQPTEKVIKLEYVSSPLQHATGSHLVMAALGRHYPGTT